MGGRLLGGAGVSGGTYQPIQRYDRSLVMCFGLPPDSLRDDDILCGSGWAIDYWPARSGQVTGGEETGLWPYSNRVTWLEEVKWSGAKAWPYFIQGFCYDNLGQPASGATVRLYRAYDDYLVATVVSAPDGKYAFGVLDNTTAYYVIANKAAPSIAGATVRTLIGSAL